MFTKALVLLAIASQAFATVFITSPVATTVLSGGKQTTITWIEGPGAPSLKDFGPARISIYAGNAKEQTSLQLISASTDVSTASSVSFTVDPSIGPNSDEYFIRVESLSLKDAAEPQYPALAFSSKFRMDSMTGRFSQTVLDQIAGQTTAPIGGSTAVSSNSAVPSSSGSGAVVAVSSASASRKASSTGSSAKPSGSTQSNANSETDGALAHSVGFAGLILTAFVTISLL